MEIIWFTLTAAMLYLVSDWIIRQIEKRRGQPLANRSVVFFLIFLPLVLITFELIQRFGQSAQ
jgi:predicted PurR-regulated permease PerM